MDRVEWPLGGEPSRKLGDECGKQPFAELRGSDLQCVQEGPVAQLSATGRRSGTGASEDRDLVPGSRERARSGSDDNVHPTGVAAAGHGGGRRVKRDEGDAHGHQPRVGGSSSRSGIEK